MIKNEWMRNKWIQKKGKHNTNAWLLSWSKTVWIWGSLHKIFSPFLLKVCCKRLFTCASRTGRAEVLFELYPEWFGRCEMWAAAISISGSGSCSCLWLPVECKVSRAGVIINELHTPHCCLSAANIIPVCECESVCVWEREREESRRMCFSSSDL